MRREEAEGASGARAPVVPPSRKWDGFGPHLIIPVSSLQCRPLWNHLSVSKLGKDQEVENICKNGMYKLLLGSVGQEESRDEVEKIEMIK